MLTDWFSNDLATPSSPSAHLADGEWHKVAAIWDGETQSLVVDGKELASRKPPQKLHVATKDNFCVGSTSEAYDQRWDGELRAIRIWAVARQLHELDVGCSAWGATVLLLLSIGGAGYFGGGVLHASRTQGRALRLQSHPHFQQWVQLHGLCADGVEFARSRRGRAGMGSKGKRGGGYGSVGEGRAERKEGKKKWQKQKAARKGERRRSEERDGAADEDDAAPQQPAIAEAGGGGDAGGASTSTEAGGGGRWVHVTSA